MIFHLIFIIVGNQDLHKSMDEYEFRSDSITDYGVSCPWAHENYSFIWFPLQFLILSDNENWHYILNVWIYSWSLFQVQSDLPLGIVNFGVSKRYARSQVSDRCTLGYLFSLVLFCLGRPLCDQGQSGGGKHRMAMKLRRVMYTPYTMSISVDLDHVAGQHSGIEFVVLDMHSLLFNLILYKHPWPLQFIQKTGF